MADTQNIIYCPACNTEMKKISLPDQGINIDICEHCGGMYFDNRELQKAQDDEKSVNTLIESIGGEKDFAPVDVDAPRVCPACGTNMVKMGGSIGIEYDACNVCGGKFLDNGELKKMHEFVLKGEDKFDKALEAIYPQNTVFNARHQFFVNMYTKKFLK